MISQCPSSVGRRAASTTDLKDYFSYTPGPVDQWTRNLVGSIGVTGRSKIAKLVLTAAVLKIYI